MSTKPKLNPRLWVLAQFLRTTQATIWLGEDGKVWAEIDKGVVIQD